MRVGIFFGGQSREREISFAGGRTVYDNLNKQLFEPIPIFIDSLGHFIQLDWQYIYKGTIRDFYPPTEFYPTEEKRFQIYIESIKSLDNEKINSIISKVGKRIEPFEFKSHFDLAFLALHGPYGEDGNIQGILEWYGIPYTGCGILPSAIGVNKQAQKELMQMAGFDVPDYEYITSEKWTHFSKEQRAELFESLIMNLGLPLVIKAPNQGSSIGVSIVTENNIEIFEKSVNKSLFIQEMQKAVWQGLTDEKKLEFVTNICDIRVGIGLPVVAKSPFTKGAGGTLLVSPSELLHFVNEHFHFGHQTIILESINGESGFLVEKFVKGIEFSCIVIQDEAGNPIALPPTQIVKGTEIFDYRSKYLPGITRKVTPIDLPLPFIYRIREDCEKLYKALKFNVYARLDGFFADDGKIYLNDPNTTSGMMPSSFFFHQAAEIGLNPSQFLTYIIRTSLAERLKTGKNIHQIEKLLYDLDKKLSDLANSGNDKIKIAVIMGGYSTERHISVESGRNVYEKLASSTKYEPTPVFLTLPEGIDFPEKGQYDLYELPTNIMLKDNADDIREKILKNEDTHEVIVEIQAITQKIREKYASKSILKANKISFEELASKYKTVFIALHGRPGEDGELQSYLNQYHLPFNGSNVESSSTTINKYKTNEILRKAGFLVANHRLIEKGEWQANKQLVMDTVEKDFQYPIIAKPHDDGCSSAVKKLKNRTELAAFAEMMFRTEPSFLKDESEILHLKYHEEFPRKQQFLLEELITKRDADHFLEITGGMLTNRAIDGTILYEIFEPSETLASGEILSLEEKFLAGEGQNITPSRFSKNVEEQVRISAEVKKTFFEVAKVLNVEGYCRIDAFVRIYDSGKVETIIIEINSLPGMTPATCIFHQCAINGYKPYDFIDRILEYGKTRV
ncbi:MAG: D-alanine--D-alanine ligase [Cytophagales bacterium]